MDKAAEPFAKRGYEATSTGDIAEACGSSKLRPRQYFGSKEDILPQLLTEHIDPLLAGCHDTLDARFDPVERFCVLVRFVFRIIEIETVTGHNRCC
ncbi:TetR/AcrR family transcriptional regulator [Thalassococcus sp. S3]|uniref:TetR/AcrR family transcriptional regulator n=1 Tax=Thalassococcus sp. S3 TaxID=2017482 RepID=UPI00352E07AB